GARRKSGEGRRRRRRSDRGPRSRHRHERHLGGAGRDGRRDRHRHSRRRREQLLPADDPTDLGEHRSALEGLARAYARDAGRRGRGRATAGSRELEGQEGSKGRGRLMAGGAQDDDDGGLVSGINVTPLVDITLVLLIIMMVTAKIIVSNSLPLDLPQAAKG